MIKNIYGYICDIETGIIISMPKSFVSVHQGEDLKPVYTMLGTRPGDKTYVVSGIEGEPCGDTETNMCTVCFNEPDPIKAKAIINDYIYKMLLNQEKKYEAELEKVRERKANLLKGLGLHDA